MEKGLSEEEIIAIGDLETSSHPYVAEVRNTLNNLEKRLSEASSGLITSPSDRTIKRIMAPMALMTRKPRGFGFVASSFEHNKSMETLWAAIIAKAFMESGINFHPIVMPVDEYYRYMPSYLSIVGKTTEISERKRRDNSGRPYAMVLTGFTNSVVFRQDVLQEMPNQYEIYGDSVTGRKPISVVKEFEEFSTYASERIFGEQKGSLNGVINALSKEGSKKDAELLLCSVLLLHDCQMWQNLWYECKEGIPLYIVAPFEFHESMDRINLNWGHGALDYSYRAQFLRANRYPPISVADGKLKDELEYLEEEESELIYKRGLKGAEFEARIKPILEKFL